MIELLVDRRWPKPKYTIGAFSVDGKRMCESLEDTDRGLASNWTLAAIKASKIAGRTAIPKGRYKIVLSVSPKFKSKSWARKYGGLVPEILNVPGFSGVRIHPGTTAQDTDGCILLGDNKAIGKVLNSQKRYYELMDKYLMPANVNKEEIYITIQ